MGRQARGVRAMALPEGDYLVGMEVVERGRPDPIDRRKRLRQAHPLTTTA
jgi:DNA gyrase/topoisomerase IV subunit A